MLKAILFLVLAMTYAALAAHFEQNIMQVLGTSKAAGFFYVYGIFLTPLVTLLAFSMTAYQSWAARKKEREAR